VIVVIHHNHDAEESINLRHNLGNALLGQNKFEISCSPNRDFSTQSTFAQVNSAGTDSGLPAL
jgi:hypothetical protein